MAKSLKRRIASASMRQFARPRNWRTGRPGEDGILGYCRILLRIQRNRTFAPLLSASVYSRLCSCIEHLSYRVSSCCLKRIPQRHRPKIEHRNLWPHSHAKPLPGNGRPFLPATSSPVSWASSEVLGRSSREVPYEAVNRTSYQAARPCSGRMRCPTTPVWCHQPQGCHILCGRAEQDLWPNTSVRHSPSQCIRCP